MSHEKKASELLQEIFDYFKDNSELKQYNHDNFGSVGTVQIGFDAKDTPEQSDMPVLVIGPVNRADRGDTKSEKNYLVFMSVTIVDNQKIQTKVNNDGATVQDKTMGTIEYTGERKALLYLEKIESMFYQSDIVGAKDSVGESQQKSDFPVFRALTAFTISLRTNTRRGTR